MAKTPEIDLRDDYLQNYLINGNFDFWQRNTTFTSLNGYGPDRFRMGYDTTAGRVTVSRETSILPSNGLSLYSCKLQTSVADASVDAADLASFTQIIEGHILRPLKDKHFTLSFWVYSNVIGTYPVSFHNQGFGRSYVTTFSITQSNVWQKVTISLQHNSTGSWLYNEGIGMIVRLNLMAGSTQQTVSTNQWINGNFHSTSGCINFLSSTSNIMYVSQFMLNEGSDALPYKYHGKSFEGELQSCQRYFYKTYRIEEPLGTLTQFGAVAFVPDLNAALRTQLHGPLNFPVTMRAAPVFTIYDHFNGAANTTIRGFQDTGVSRTFSTVQSANVNMISSINTTTDNDRAMVFHVAADAEL